MPLGSFVLRRLAQIPLTVLLISLILFGLMHVSPGDPVSVMLGIYATPEATEALRAEFHLDKPLPQQYVLWVKRLLQGDLGYSIRTREAVTQIIADRFPLSLSLAAAATVVALLVAIPAGAIAAYKRNSAWDYGLMALTTAGLSIPNFAMALFLLLIFAIRLEWVPISGLGFYSFRDNPWLAITPFFLPVASLAFPLVAELARLTRANMLEVLDQDYIRVALAKGVSPSRMLFYHALRNGLIPIITVTAINFAYLVGTTITIEFIFAIPGVGSALIQAVINRDFPVIQGLTLVMALFFIVTNIVADILYVMVDPRVVYR